MSGEAIISTHEEYHETTHVSWFRRMCRSVRHTVWQSLVMWGWERYPVGDPPPEVKEWYATYNASVERHESKHNR